MSNIIYNIINIICDIFIVCVIIFFIIAYIIYRSKRKYIKERERELDNHYFDKFENTLRNGFFKGSKNDEPHS